MKVVSEEHDKIIGAYMGWQAPFTSSWDWLMMVGDRMEKDILEGNWGLFEPFFSDEMSAYDKFVDACKRRNHTQAVSSILEFINSLENQDIELIKKAKEYEGN